MKNNTAIILFWLITVLCVCFIVYVTKCGWWVLILGFFNCSFGDDEKEKEN